MPFFQCLYCINGWHNECDCPVEEDTKLWCCCPSDAVIGESLPRALLKANDEVTDVLSTGRKRAAKDFPMVPNAPCEWQRLKFAGGGVEPIIGCLNGKQQARHHGPDKSVLNNTTTNVHRICHGCHNRWHTKNDAHYGERPDAGQPFVPIDGKRNLLHDYETVATDKEILNNELAWKNKTVNTFYEEVSEDV